MDDNVITIRDLGKCYKAQQKPGSASWALRHIDLEISRGEVWGIIGRNGAGKSTLLKLLAQVTRPSEGSFRISGKVYAILELGMGFHSELTGIDNLYVAGALQGMKRSDIRRRLGAIVEFSGLGDSIYQPLRTYSSGMRVRLAFALAAHSFPDILILDEILAVGDEEFQRKCFEVIREFIAAGVTVLFVSHDMKLISLICKQCLLLQNGEIVARGGPEAVIESYSRIMGPSISRHHLTLTHAGHYMHLFSGEFPVTRRFGLYTSIRVNRVWYDPAYILWDQQTRSDDRIELTGHFMTVPISMTWVFHLSGDHHLHWQVTMCLGQEIHIERFQANVMLSRYFTEWEAGGTRARFPEDFDWFTGEDWTRHWIGAPESRLAAVSSGERGRCRVEFSSDCRCGAMVVVTSSPEFSANVLQYLRTWNEGDHLGGGSHQLFSGRISVPEITREHVIDGGGNGT